MQGVVTRLSKFCAVRSRTHVVSRDDNVARRRVLTICVWGTVLDLHAMRLGSFAEIGDEEFSYSFKASLANLGR